MLTGKIVARAENRWGAMVLTALINAVLLLVALVLVNLDLLRQDLIPSDDFAADMLWMQKAQTGLLLTGHYTFSGVHHPGPFMLYARLLGRWLASGWTGSDMGAQLVGVFAHNVLLVGVFTALMHRLASRLGASGWQAFAGATGTTLLLLTLSSIQGGPVAVSQAFVPAILVLPYSAFMVAAVLTLLGSAVGFVLGWFVVLVLLHLYIPMIFVAAPIWLVVCLWGWRVRHQCTGQGFPLMIVGVMAGLFALPILLDMFLDPPGNLVAIIKTGQSLHHNTPRPSLSEVTLFLARKTVAVFWLAVPMAAVLLLVWKRYRRFLLLAAGVEAAVILATFVFYYNGPLPMLGYTVNFFKAAAFFPVLCCLLLLVIEAMRRRAAYGGLILCALLGAMAFWGSVAGFYPSAVGLRDLARQIVADTPPGSEVALASGKRWRISLSGLMIELDKTPVRACNLDPGMDFYVSPERRCRTQPYAAYLIEVENSRSDHVVCSAGKFLLFSDSPKLPVKFCVSVIKMPS